MDEQASLAVGDTFFRRADPASAADHRALGLDRACVLWLRGNDDAPAFRFGFVERLLTIEHLGSYAAANIILT
jgi:hypothetical protein